MVREMDTVGDLERRRVGVKDIVRETEPVRDTEGEAEKDWLPTRGAQKRRNK